MTLEKAFCSWFNACFQNVCIIWVFVVACGFSMLFYRGANIPIIVPGLCSAPEDFQLLLLSPTYVNGHVLQLTYICWRE